MSTQTIDLERIESLIQAIGALPLAEQTIIRSRLRHFQLPKESIQKRSVLEILCDSWDSFSPTIKPIVPSNYLTETLWRNLAWS